VKTDEDLEHQAEKLSAEQMTVLVSKYDTESKVAYEHGETTRIQAYRSRDIIRMTCVDDKIGQMKTLSKMAATPMLMLRTFKAELRYGALRGAATGAQSRDELAASLVCIRRWTGSRTPHPRKAALVTRRGSKRPRRPPRVRLVETGLPSP
jgi:hypothetical protein